MMSLQNKILCVFHNNLIFVRTYAKLRRFKQVQRMRGIPPYLGKSLDQRIEEANYKDPDVYYKVNIGLPKLVDSKVQKERFEHRKKIKNDSELEKKARKNQIQLCLEDVAKDWCQESGPEHIKEAAEYYGVFEDLFGDAFFFPQVSLDVAFKNEEVFVPVYRGNLIKPNQALTAPEVSYEAEPDSLWTLIVTNPDGLLSEETAECLHWFVGNIPGNKVKEGEVVANYIQPFPVKGVGYQRFILILYKQTEKIDYSSQLIPSKEVNLKNRKFSTYDFYRSHQDRLTPGGLAFCQVDWDPSVSQFFHTVLGIEEPFFEYDFEPHYYTPQKMFPLKQPFNLYLNRYRDPKQIAKEYLLKKFKNRHPFEKPKAPLRFPNAVPVKHDLDERLFGRIPSWLRKEKLKERLGYGRINDY